MFIRENENIIYVVRSKGKNTKMGYKKEMLLSNSKQNVDRFKSKKYKYWIPTNS